MSNENLAQIETLQEQEGKEAISKIQEIKQKAEVSFEGDVVGAAEKAISELTGAGNETTKSMQAETNIAINTAKSMGGTEQKVKEISESVQNEVSTAVESGKQEISEVKNENQEKNKLENIEGDIKYKEKSLETLEANIAHVEQQKNAYIDLLDQEVVYISEEYMNGIAKIISPETEKYTKLWEEFPVYPFTSTPRSEDKMADDLKEKNFSPERIEEFKKKRQELFTLQDEIRKKYGSKIKNQDGGLGFSNSNTIKELHHPFLYVGHGSHYFDGSLLNKKMKLGDLLNKEEEIKKEKRDKTIQEIQELRKQKEAIVKV
ncbi:hypothetical protein A3B93_02440 [Candidatus Nomurabacteria bacterium RIFCSPHIGHO2_02_FULL_42_24]|uniref:Uncharacterized protein n=1 Tax=Candidatus Nomurabacteria bacterium RIFCSPHIGHO2_02_FULL_42_24 TaxID=1801757 RepID=A0A1F6WJG8_9BACT|nr:MAG: hypothetical protein UV08_C0020G0014 [Parcubacteria group bacterium GW2011_GWA2_42_18]OGI82051.1 MAG: hypothetical protein A3B93_02440 [Candidatus Nomurabacteria bacterium RIFCSPHIGHO2_02_FULL_42_24]